MKETFEPRRLTGTISLTLSNKEKWVKDKATLCAEIIEIITRYSAQGYRLTLRQLYYQLVAAAAIRNDDVVYKKMSGILDDLRYSGQVDWDAIEDRGRVPNLPYWVFGIEDAINDTIRDYRLDRQNGQENAVEVWTEKDAISGILKRVTHKYHVRLVVNKGYSSSSAMHQAYSRFAAQLNDDKNVKILYFGDHDPSGLDMLRDIKQRILFFIVNGSQVHEPDIPEEFDGVYYDFFQYYEEENHLSADDLADNGYMSREDADVWMSMYADDAGYEDMQEKYQTAMKMHYWATRFEVIPIGLTMQQIRQYNPPPNPAKLTDPRSDWYIQQHGGTSWEVDALPPNVMTYLVMRAIENNIDMEKYDAMLELEKVPIAKLREFQEKSKEAEPDSDEEV